MIASLITYSLLYMVQFYKARHKRYQLFRYYGIPGPKQNILNGNYDIWGKLPYTLDMDENLRDRYGKIIGIFVGDIPSIVVADLKILEKVFIEDTAIFKDRCDVLLKISGTMSILFAPYKEWTLYRKIMSPPFRRYAMRGKTTHLIEETVKSIVDYIDARLEPNDSGKLATCIDIQGLMKSAMLKVISVIAIKLPDVQVGEHDEYVGHLETFLSYADSVLANSPVWMRGLARVLEGLLKIYEGRLLGQVKREIDLAINDYAKRKSNDSSDQQNHIIDTLIRSHHEGRLSRSEVMNNALAILLAGYDTSSTALTYLFWVLAKHTDVQDKLRSDLIAHGIESQYMDQVIYESLRRYPTVRTFLTRVASENVQYDNLMIPRGTIVLYNSWLLHFDPEIWPDPMRFDPDRFSPGKTRHPCAFAPFGFGERRCIGYQLAMLEMKMIVCDIIIRYKIHLKTPTELEQCVSAKFLTRPRETVVIEFERSSQ